MWRRLSSSSSVARPGNSFDHRPLGLGPDDHREAGGAVVGAAAVLARPAPELAPDVDEDAVGEAARLEVGLEGGQRSRELLEVAGQRAVLVVVGVVAAVGVERDHLQRQAHLEHLGQHRQPPREAVLARVGDRGLPRRIGALEVLELRAEPDRLGRGAAGAGELGVARREAALRLQPFDQAACGGWRPRRRGRRARSTRARRRRRPACRSWRARARGSSRARGPGAGCRPPRACRDSARASRRARTG